MFYVYILRSISHSNQIYIRYTNNLSKRFAVHNAGHSTYAAKYVPWEILSYITFLDSAKAIEFEKYLKTNAGKIFLNRRFL